MGGAQSQGRHNRVDDVCASLDALQQAHGGQAGGVEVWGGATFDSCLRFLDEDPWERLRTLRKMMPNTKLQMLFRGQNMLGYRHYADDVLEYFVQKSHVVLQGEHLAGGVGDSYLGVSALLLGGGDGSLQIADVVGHRV